jgi:hypothetical protein
MNRGKRTINGRFKTISKPCSCSSSAPVETENFVQPVTQIQGILEDVLGYGEGASITTVGVSLDMKSTINIALGIGGGIVLGALAKKSFNIK